MPTEQKTQKKETGEEPKCTKARSVSPATELNSERRRNDAIIQILKALLSCLCYVQSQKQNKKNKKPQTNMRVYQPWYCMLPGVL